jgi:hypothetical protein
MQIFCCCAGSNSFCSDAFAYLGRNPTYGDVVVCWVIIGAQFWSEKSPTDISSLSCVASAFLAASLS